MSGVIAAVVIPSELTARAVVGLMKVEQIKQVADGRTVERNVRIARRCDGIGHVVAASIADGREIPVALDELQQGDVVGVFMGDVSRLGPGRHDDQRDAGAVAEEVEGLNVT